MKRLLVALALLTPACFNVDERPCTFACGPGGACPDDYTCLNDGYCHLHGQPGACGYSDMSMPDLPETDAAPADLNGADGPGQEDGPPPGPDATPGCFDGVQNGSETDIDCGGSCAAKCTLGKKCAAGTDCSTTFCGAVSHVCVASSCVDQAQDFGETDVDCGGVSTCGKCALNKMCGGLANGARDCTSGVCSMTSHRCVADTCSDQALDNGETDVDCGGATACNSCSDGQMCGGFAFGGRDCTSGICSATSHVCVADSCHDQTQNNGETDIDCGGTSTCGTCANGKMCMGITFGVRDCTSGVCSSTSHVCVATACFDQVQDNAETDVDCGGGTCAATCALGKKCGGLANGARDCMSGVCSATSMVCVGSTCTDQSKDNGESDVDCGGPVGTCATRCGAGAMCTLNTDCASGICLGSSTCM